LSSTEYAHEQFSLLVKGIIDLELEIVLPFRIVFLFHNFILSWYYLVYRYYERKLIWEDLEEENIDVNELDSMFSKRHVEPSRRFSPNKPKNKAKQVSFTYINMF
jgi:hypothetical protein